MNRWEDVEIWCYPWKYCQWFEFELWTFFCFSNPHFCGFFFWFNTWVAHRWPGTTLACTITVNNSCSGFQFCPLSPPTWNLCVFLGLNWFRDPSLQVPWVKEWSYTWLGYFHLCSIKMPSQQPFCCRYPTLLQWHCWTCHATSGWHYSVMVFKPSKQWLLKQKDPRL